MRIFYLLSFAFFDLVVISAVSYLDENGGLRLEARSDECPREVFDFSSLNTPGEAGWGLVEQTLVEFFEQFVDGAMAYLYWMLCLKQTVRAV
jgi:hypothetical protein